MHDMHPTLSKEDNILSGDGLNKYDIVQLKD